MSTVIKSPCEQWSSLNAPSALRTCRGPWILIVTILGSSMAFIDGTVVNVALPALQSDLHASMRDIQWVVESYALLLASLLLLGGSLGDLYGRRKIFVCGVVLFAVGSAWCGVAPSIGSPHPCSGPAGRWSRIPRAWKSSDHQCLLFGRSAGASYWDVVGFHSDHGRNWSGSWGMACSERLLALGVLYKHSFSTPRSLAHIVARSRESK
jgi:MFS family permease